MFATEALANQPGVATSTHTLPAPATADSASGQQKAIKLTEYGLAARKVKNYPLAISYYTAALNFYQLLDALIGRCLVYDEAHEREKSADDAVATARIMTNTGTHHEFAVKFYDLAGLDYYLSKKYDKSIASFSESISIDPLDPKIYVFRANAYKMKFDFENTLSDLKKAMELDPKSIAAQDSYAMTFADLGLYQFAIDKLNDSLVVDKGSSTTYMNLGQVYTSMGKYDEARGNLNRALQLDPQNWDAVSNSVKLNFYTKNYVAASRDADTWLDNNRESSPSIDVEYALIWKHISSQPQRVDDRASLEMESVKLRDQNAWPHPIIDFFLSKIDADQLRAATVNGDAEFLKIRKCEAEAYIGETNLTNGKVDDATKNFETASSLCPPSWAEYDLSKFELKSIKNSAALP